MVHMLNVQPHTFSHTNDCPNIQGLFVEYRPSQTKAVNVLAKVAEQRLKCNFGTKNSGSWSMSTGGILT